MLSWIILSLNYIFLKTGKWLLTPNSWTVLPITFLWHFQIWQNRLEWSVVGRSHGIKMGLKSTEVNHEEKYISLHSSLEKILLKLQNNAVLLFEQWGAWKSREVLCLASCLWRKLCSIVVFRERCSGCYLTAKREIVITYTHFYTQTIMDQVSYRAQAKT